MLKEEEEEGNVVVDSYILFLSFLQILRISFFGIPGFAFAVAAAGNVHAQIFFSHHKFINSFVIYILF